MTLIEIEAFLMVAKCGSLTAAAEELFITQPALSRRIKMLEEELGYGLVIRGKGLRNIELTKKGIAFFPIAEKWMLLWQETQQVARLKERRLLTVSAVNSMHTYILPPVYQQFLKQEPNCCLHIANQYSAIAYNMVANELLDLAFTNVGRYVKSVDTVPLIRQQMVVIADKSAGYENEIQPSELDPGKEVRIPIGREFDAWHDKWFESFYQQRVTLDQVNLLPEFLADGQTWAIVPETVADRMIQGSTFRKTQLLDAPPERVIYYLVNGQNENPYIGQFLRVLKEHLKKYTVVSKDDISLMNPLHRPNDRQ